MSALHAAAFWFAGDCLGMFGRPPTGGGGVGHGTHVGGYICGGLAFLALEKPWRRKEKKGIATVLKKLLEEVTDEMEKRVSKVDGPDSFDVPRESLPPLSTDRNEESDDDYVTDSSDSSDDEYDDERFEHYGT